ncbi:hypothetical protein [Anaerocolumna xylanovorans]|nr:hypothetical protein [Anaerocolumna xylanovorans]
MKNTLHFSNVLFGQYRRLICDMREGNMQHRDYGGRDLRIGKAAY